MSCMSMYVGMLKQSPLPLGDRSAGRLATVCPGYDGHWRGGFGLSRRHVDRRLWPSSDRYPARMAEPPSSRRRLTRDDLALQARVPPEYVDELVAAGVIAG